MLTPVRPSCLKHKRIGQRSSSNLTRSLRFPKDTVEFSVLGLWPHAAQLLLVTAQAPGVIADLFRAQTTVPIQHLKWNIWVDVHVHPGALCLLDVAGIKTKQGSLLESMYSPDTYNSHAIPSHSTISCSFFCTLHTIQTRQLLTQQILTNTPGRGPILINLGLITWTSECLNLLRRFWFHIQLTFQGFFLCEKRFTWMRTDCLQCHRMLG